MFKGQGKKGDGNFKMEFFQVRIEIDSPPHQKKPKQDKKTKKTIVLELLVVRKKKTFWITTD